MLTLDQTINEPPTLKLVGTDDHQVEIKSCFRCQGLGHVPCPQTVAVRTLGFNAVPALQPSTGHPIPCPTCHGKKVVVSL
jgi:DnaJ-class molecular chaperone